MSHSEIWIAAFSAVTGLCAVIVSAAVAGIALWQGYETRLQNRLSKKPILVFEIVLPGPSNVKTHATLLLHNRGLGLASFRRVSILIREKRKYFDGKEGFDEITELAQKLHVTLPTRPLRLHLPSAPGAQMANEPPKKLMEIENTAIDGAPTASEELKKLLTQLNIRIEFESIYGELQPTEYLHENLQSESEFADVGFPVKPNTRFQDFWAAIKILIR